MIAQGNVIVEGRQGLYLAGRASLVEDSREIAWAEQHVRHDPDLKWVLGNYVEADNANSNGHIFPLEDLKDAQGTISNKPLNMLHQERRIVGHYVGAEMLYPTEGSTSYPYVEALAAFYRYYFPDEYEVVEAAHKEGALFFSMEAAPQELACAAEGCGLTFAYRGRKHDSYCAHLQEPVARRRLIKPHFKGGALIIPPIRPGWTNADVKELSALVERDVEMAEHVYEQVKDAAPHLEARIWEALMGLILEEAAGPSMQNLNSRS